MNCFNDIKQKIIINLWNYLNTTVNEKYRLTQLWGKRSEIIDFYCKGKGIEIGASAYPVKIYNKNTKVSYVDCIDRNIKTDIKTHAGLPYVNVDILDEADKLEKIRNGSLDFIIHCHVLEHCNNPIGLIRTHLSKLKKNGIIAIAIPNKDYMFDKDRPLTEWEHFVLDDEIQFDSLKNREHFREYLQLSIKFKGDIEKEIDRLIEDDYRPHLHVWDFNSFYYFLMKTNNKLNNAFVIEHYSENRLNRRTPHETREIITILRKG